MEEEVRRGGLKCLSVRDSADRSKMFRIHTAVVEETVKGEAGAEGGKEWGGVQVWGVKSEHGEEDKESVDHQDEDEGELRTGKQLEHEERREDTHSGTWRRTWDHVFIKPGKF